MKALRINTRYISLSRGSISKWRGITPVFFAALIMLLMIFSASCSNQEQGGQQPAVAEKQGAPATLKLATTTSTENSGLLDIILPDFEKKHNAVVKVIAVGTGKALMLGENGDVDILMVHAPAAEKEFIKGGWGISRKEFMYNDFVIIGPASDPAGIKEVEKAQDALKAIADNGSEFISRGDDSGTHKKELSLWKAAGIEPSGAWYLEVGRGMGAVLTMASEKQAYTLTDRGTYLSMIDNLEIEPLLEGDPVLYNVYSVIPINPEVHEHVNIDLANTFVEWVSSKEVQQFIGEYQINGKQLFHPMLLD